MRQVRAWLSIGPDGLDETAYQENARLIDAVVPVRGALNADGTWTERYPWPFSRELPELAKANGQRYEPAFNSGHDDNWLNMIAVLDDARLWSVAADNLIELGTRTGYDAPWDGVVYDMVFNIRPDYKERSEQFTRYLCERVQGAGLSFTVTHGGILSSDEENRHDIDLFAAMGGVEWTFYMCPYEPTFAPWWWAADSVPNLLGHGTRRGNLYFGIGNFGQYWPVTGEDAQRVVHYSTIMEMVEGHCATVEWVEQGDRGLIRMKYAKLGDGHTWFVDADVVRSRLRMVDRLGLAGIMLFRASTGDPAIWRTIADWKQEPDPRPGCRPIKRPKVGNRACALMATRGLFSTPV